MLQAILFIGTIFTRLYLIFSISALPGVILSLIVIWLIGKLIKNDNTVKRLINVIIVAFCIYISMNIFFTSPNTLNVMNIIGKIGEFEKPDNLYVKMNKINDNKSLVGLSKEELVELFGEPKSEYKNIYDYSAGIIKIIYIWGGYSTDYYELCVEFDENDRVKSTSIQPRRGG